MSIRDFRYDGEKKLVLKNLPTGAPGMKQKKPDLVRKTEENMVKVAALQNRLMAAGTEGLIVAIQARDAAGKDSLIRHLFGQLDPAGLQITSFKTPTKTDLAHDYLWRINAALPPRGMIGVFNRSHYEDVLVTRVHAMEKTYQMPKRVTEAPDFYQRRYRQLNDWERYLYENGYRMVKIFLNVGQEKQCERFLDRMELPEKHYKLSLNDMKERALWDDYNAAYEDAVNATGTPESPWYVVPADTKWYTRYIVSEILLDTLERMAPEYPPLNAADAAQIPAAMEELYAQCGSRRKHEAD